MNATGQHTTEQSTSSRIIRQRHAGFFSPLPRTETTSGDW